jgi:hypothetical protein
MTAPDGSANSRRLDLEAEVLGVVQVERETDELAQRARAEHEAVGAALRDTVRHAMAAGEILLKAKAGMPHGLFGDWLETKAGVPRRTAQVYMRLARELPKLPQEKRNAVAHLSLRDAIAELSRTSGKVAKLPPPVLDTALDEARSEPIKKTVTRATNKQQYVNLPAPTVFLPASPTALAASPLSPLPPPSVLVDELLGACFTWKQNHPETTDQDILEALNDAYCRVADGALDPGTGEVWEKTCLMASGTKVLVLTPSDHPGFTYVSVLDGESGEVIGTKKPLRDDAIDEYVSERWGAPMPTEWRYKRSTRHRENPHLLGSEPLFTEERREAVDPKPSGAIRRLEQLRFEEVEEKTYSYEKAGKVWHTRKVKRAAVFGLPIGEKPVEATVIMSQSRGPYVQKVRLTKAYVGPYGGEDECLVWDYLEPGKRKPESSSDKLRRSGLVALVRGWHDFSVLPSPERVLFHNKAELARVWSDVDRQLEALGDAVICNFIGMAIEQHAGGAAP